MSEAINFVYFISTMIFGSIVCSIFFLSTVYIERKFDLEHRPTEAPGFAIITVGALFGLLLFLGLYELFQYFKEKKFVEDLKAISLIGRLFVFILVTPLLISILGFLDLENQVRERAESFLDD